MTYPCIVYNRNRSDTKFAGDKPYLFFKRYTLTIIDSDPDSELVDKVAELPMCVHSTFYIADSLNHDVFDIYF